MPVARWQSNMKSAIVAFIMGGRYITQGLTTQTNPAEVCQPILAAFISCPPIIAINHLPFQTRTNTEMEV